METAEDIKQRELVEKAGNRIPELNKPKAEQHRPRYDRRLEKRKRAILEKLVLEYFTQRSTLNDPDGEDAAKVFDIKEYIWHNECRNFNVHRTPFKLKYEAFAEAVEYYLKMENKQKKQTVEINKSKGFDHWFRRARVGRTHPLTCVYFWVISFFSREKYLNHWKNYYKALQPVKNI